jgi:uncharacterized protein (TIGR00251 family)
VPETAWLRVKGGAIEIDIKAQPGASKTELAGIKDGRLRVRLAAAPEGGKANAELCRFLAGALGCPKRDIVLLRGGKSRLKTLRAPLSCREMAGAMGEKP